MAKVGKSKKRKADYPAVEQGAISKSDRPKKEKYPYNLSPQERQAMWNQWWADFLAPILAEMQGEEENPESLIMKPEV